MTALSNVSFPTLKILIDARCVRTQKHGIARYTVELIQGLSKLGQKITILTHSPETLEVIGRQNITEEIHCGSDFLNPREIIELSRLQYDEFDFVHFPSFALPWKVPTKSIISIHDLIHLYKPSKIFHHFYYQTVVRHALHQCQKVITGAEWSKKEINRLLGVPLQKITVVRDGIQSSWLTKTQSESPLNEEYFLCLSNPKIHKNVRTLIDACKILWTKGSDFKLALSLGGADLPTEFNLSAEEKAKIHVLKGIEDSKLKIFFENALAVISTSEYEGYNYPAVEAAALDIPVILSRGSANDEFYGSLIYHYGLPHDTSGLVRAMAERLAQGKSHLKNDYPIPTALDMARETLKAYLS